MNDKLVCVTGASRGIGLALVRHYLRHGLKVLAVSRSADTIQVSAEEEKLLVRVKVDISSAGGIEALSQEVEKAGRLTVLIHNAGKLVFKPFGEISKDELTTVYNVNVFAPFMVTQSLMKYMETCHVINVSSIGGVENSLKFSGLSAYSSSKAALNCLTQMWAEEFKDTDHTFNCLALGSVETEMFKEAFPGVKASCSPQEMAEYVFEFEKTARSVQNGKIISVSRSNP